MQDTDSISMETLKLAADVLARPDAPETKEVRVLAQALLDANTTIVGMQGKQVFEQKS